MLFRSYLVTGMLQAVLLAPLSPVIDPATADLLLAFLPLLVGAVAAGIALYQKWGLLPTERMAAHTGVSIAALVLPIFSLVLVALRIFAALPLEAKYLHALAAFGASFTGIGLATAWSGSAGKKTASLVFAAVPAVILLLIVLVPNQPVENLRFALLLGFFLSAVLYQLSGSMLTLLATGTDVDRRLILKSAEGKMRQMDGELRERLRALAWREKAVGDLETDVQSRERELSQFEHAADQRRRELQGLESRVGSQFAELKELEASVTKTRAELEAKNQEAVRAERELREREGAVQQAKQVLEAREAAVGEREQQLKREQIETKARERRVADTESELTDFEARLRLENERFEAKRAEVIRMEKDLELKQSELRLVIEQSEAALATQDEARIREIRDYHDKVTAKEREVGKLEVDLRALQASVQEREGRIAADLARVEGERRALRARDEELTQREKALSDREAADARRRQDLDTTAAEAQRDKAQLADRSAESDALLKDVRVRAAEIGAVERDLRERLAAVEEREVQVTSTRANVTSEVESMNQQHRDLLAKEKELQQREERLGVRELEVARQADRAAANGGEQRDKTFELRERRLREKEEELTRRFYEKQKELEMREQALAARQQGTGEGEEPVVEVPVTATTQGDKVKTGTRRFDDLLLGGLPFNAHVAFVGPPFAGKEVLLYNFIAEGLRSKVPAVIVTTGRTPVDVAKEMAPVLPSLMDYDRLGLVHWVDASGTEKTRREGNVWRVGKASDLDAIYEAVSRLDTELMAKGFPYFRLAYLSLSNSVGRVGEEEAVTFLQKLLNRMRQTKCISVFAIEKGMHPDQQLQALEHLLDGAVFFKEEGTKRFISVRGVGDVQTRNWVEYTHTNKEVTLRAFTLERIR